MAKEVPQKVTTTKNFAKATSSKVTKTKASATKSTTTTTTKTSSSVTASNAHNERLREMEKKFSPEYLALVRAAMERQGNAMRRHAAETKKEAAKARRPNKEALADNIPATASRTQDPGPSYRQPTIASASRSRQTAKAPAPPKHGAAKPSAPKRRRRPATREQLEEKPIEVYLQYSCPGLPAEERRRRWYSPRNDIWTPRPTDTYWRGWWYSDESVGPLVRYQFI